MDNVNIEIVGMVWELRVDGPSFATVRRHDHDGHVEFSVRCGDRDCGRYDDLGRATEVAQRAAVAAYRHAKTCIDAKQAFNSELEDATGMKYGPGAW